MDLQNGSQLLPMKNMPKQPSKITKGNNMHKKALIIYYSWSGNTERIAKLIQEKVDGQLFKLEPVQAYSSNYRSCVDQAKKEIQNGFMPELKTIPDNLDSFDMIFIGSPNWWSTMAPPVLSFLKQNDLSGKTIIPFLSHGGGGKGHYAEEIKKVCKKSIVLEDLALYGNGGTTAESEIVGWLNGFEMRVKYHRKGGGL